MQVLIIVVVLSMALTPGLAELGKVAGTWVEEALAPVDAGALGTPSSAAAAGASSANGSADSAPAAAIGHSKTVRVSRKEGLGQAQMRGTACLRITSSLDQLDEAGLLSATVHAHSL